MSCSSRSSFYVASSDDKEKEELDPLEPPLNATKSERINWFRSKLPELDILNSTRKSKRLHVENIQQEAVTCSVKASKQIPRLTSSIAVSKQSNTIVEPKTKGKPSRQATSTQRTTLSSARPTNPAPRASSIKSNPRAAAFTRSSSVGKSVPTAAKSTSLTIREIPARPVSDSRGRVYSSGGRSMGRSSKISDDVNPVLMGTQMVERVVNMRKLPPPKYDDNNMNSGFGRTLSRSSLDMAMRHMNIKRSVPGNLRVSSNATNSMDKNKSSPSSYCPNMPAF
ncbi:hypothetical protein F2Q68_00028102 [Brassica cretica]|uniref:Uncharacterized protein n=1 Tax=Brassica cretica TaxID=69181 RepID=A0A8S9IEW0_BRACR|nr:hypothetical protein F2Q68_00028102 [Brassica cretica]